MSNVKIDIAAEYTGQRAFAKAEKNVSQLEAATAKLAKRFASLFAASKIYAFGKSSAMAFAEDEKAAAKLANTVKNLGLEFANPQIANFIEQLTRATGVSDNELRPALQALLTTTGSLTKSQELLKNAIDISAGSGQDLGTVAQDLANAYVGITRGIKKYNLGLTQAEIKTAGFNTILGKLNDQFGGANQAALETYGGKIQYLSNRAGEAQEIIGKGLFDALGLMTSQTADVQKLGDAFDSMATSIANISRGLGSVLGVFTQLGKLPIVSQILKFNYKYSVPGILESLGKNSMPDAGAGKPIVKWSDFVKQKQKEAAAAKIAEAAAAKRAKQLAAAQTKNTKALKEQALLKKQSTIFDMQQIQLIAALKGKLSEEDKNRVLLQLALLQGNEEEAKRLTTEIANSIDKTGQLAKYLNTLPDANNPFKSWQDYLNGILATLKQIQGVTGGGTAGGTGAGGRNYLPVVGVDIPMPTTIRGGVASGNAVTGITAGGVTLADGTVVKIDLNLDGKALAASLQNASLNGDQVYVNRLTGSFYG